MLKRVITSRFSRSAIRSRTCCNSSFVTGSYQLGYHRSLLTTQTGCNIHRFPQSTIMRSEEDISKVFLDLERLDRNLYRSRHLLPGFPTAGQVYGGLVIGQALVAAFETVPEEFYVHSLHCYFIRTGDINIPILYQVDPVRDGRSFCTRCVKAIQNGDAIYTCQISFHKEEKPVIEHQKAMPAVKSPDQCRDIGTILQELLQKQDLDDHFRTVINRRISVLPTTFEIRPIDEDVVIRATAHEPKLSFWVKSKGLIGNDHRMHECVAAYISDSGLIGAALLPHPNVQSRPGLTLSLDHAMWFHRNQLEADDWILYETESDTAARGRAFIRGRMWSKDGKLLISTAQEALVRQGKL